MIIQGKLALFNSRKRTKLLKHLKQTICTFVASILYSLYYKKRAELSDDTWILISPYSIGDTYLLCALAKHLLLRKGGGNITLLLRTSHLGVADLFPNDIAQTLPLQEKHIYWFRGARYMLPLQPGIPFVAHPRNHAAFSVLPGIWKPTESMLKQYLKFFQFASDTPLTKPKVSSAAYLSAKERLHTLGLPEKRTAILAPDAVSVDTLSSSFWHIMCRELQRCGWMVCINGSASSSQFGQNNVPILKYPMSEAIPVAELAGWVISLRSGLCDLISSANCRLSVIYPKPANSALSPFDQYSLRNQGLSKTVEEFETDLSEDHLLLVKRIISGCAKGKYRDKVNIPHLM
jgi:hypothetical protein